MRKLLIFFLIVIVTMLDAFQFKIISEPEEVTNHVGFVNLSHDDKYDINNELCGMLIVRTGIEDMNIDSVFRNRLFAREGEYWVILSAETRYVDLKKVDYVTYMVDFSKSIGRIEAGKVYEMYVDGDGGILEIPIMISCNQSDAEVFVDDELTGYTENKVFSGNVKKGNRKITVKKKDFLTISLTTDITIENNTFDFKLVPALPVTLKITSEPEGAKVYIEENVFLGTTPFEQFYDSGTYPIRIEKENYDTINEEIVISDPETIKHYIMIDIRAILTVKTHANATVKFNNSSFKGGVTNYKLAPQALKIEVFMPKAETLTRMITIKPKSQEVLEMYPEIQTGDVHITVIPSDANFELKGDAGEYYHGSGRETFIDVPVGVYQLIAKSEGYKSYEEQFSLKADEIIQKPLKLEMGSDDLLNMVPVEGGTFLMGSNDEAIDEKPAHSVTVSDFYISKYEVTQEQYESVMRENPSNFKGSGNNTPVEMVNWYNAVEFCNKLSENEGLEKCYLLVKGFLGMIKECKCNFNANGYRLPTEAEWEYAARGGVKSKGYKYSGSDNPNETAWYDDSSNKKTHSVGEKLPNELGIYDMSGNVWEWCNDWYSDSFYKTSPDNNPSGNDRGFSRVIRGGSWYFNSDACRVSDRACSKPGSKYSVIGFRPIRAN